MECLDFSCQVYVHPRGCAFHFGLPPDLFVSQMSYDTPLSSQSQQMSSQPLRLQMKAMAKDTGMKSFRSAKNFGIVGAIFAGTECCIEGVQPPQRKSNLRLTIQYRAKNDLANGIAAGCITGGALGANAGPQAAAFGCVGFAAFSAAIDSWMRSTD